MNENEIIMENLDNVGEVVELVPEKAGFDFKKAGLVVLAASAVVALGYKGYKLIKEKRAKKLQEAGNVVTGEVCDFEDDESDE